MNYRLQMSVELQRSFLRSCASFGPQRNYARDKFGFNATVNYPYCLYTLRTMSTDRTTVEKVPMSVTVLEDTSESLYKLQVQRLQVVLTVLALCTCERSLEQ